MKKRASVELSDIKAKDKAISTQKSGDIKRGSEDPLISLPMAIELKKAGLVWLAANNDFFAVPDRGMDDRIFVLSDMPANMDVFQGWPVVTFHGTAEWALDYILTAEVVWLPREEQIREVLLSMSGVSDEQSLSLTFNGRVYTCDISRAGQPLSFSAASAGDAYGRALLHCLKNGLVR
jgi:hypothetical protein